MASSVRMAGVLSRIRSLLAGADEKPAGARLVNAEPDAAFPDRADPGFDLSTTPTWLWAQMRPFDRCVLIAPPRPPSPGLACATRADLLDRLGGGGAGLFLIDWPGVAAGGGEWAALWSGSDMRLNRLAMDAFRLAERRGWAIRVVGPVDRGEAPFFQTVEAAATIITREEADALLARIGAQTGAQIGARP